MSDPLADHPAQTEKFHFLVKPIGKEEFCDRFVASMTTRAMHERFADGCEVLDYATDTALTYWEQHHFRMLGPESCVVCDMRQWHGPWV